MFCRRLINWISMNKQTLVARVLYLVLVYLRIYPILAQKWTDIPDFVHSSIFCLIVYCAHRISTHFDDCRTSKSSSTFLLRSCGRKNVCYRNTSFYER